jgi:hypothetical protein
MGTRGAAGNIKLRTLRNMYQNVFLPDGTVFEEEEHQTDQVFAAVESHSTKPRRFMERIEKMYVGWPRIELFARRRCMGWDAWGNQVEDIPDICQAAIDAYGCNSSRPDYLSSRVMPGEKAQITFIADEGYIVTPNGKHEAEKKPKKKQPASAAAPKVKKPAAPKKRAPPKGKKPAAKKKKDTAAASAAAPAAVTPDEQEGSSSSESSSSAQ